MDDLESRLAESGLQRLKQDSWDEYFAKIALVVAERSTCLRHHIGAVLVRDRAILSSGYNGAPSHYQSCKEKGSCLRDELKIPSGMMHEKCLAVHAEQNAIALAAKKGQSTLDSTLYCTHSPCAICAKILVNAGIKRFVTFGTYPDQSYLEYFKEAGIEYVRVQHPPNIITELK